MSRPPAGPPRSDREVRLPVSDDPPANAPSALVEADRRLVDACVAGESGAWEALVDRFGGLLAHVATRTARQRGFPVGPADRDDLVAEILVELLRDEAAALRGFGGRASLATYLAVIARRTTARRLVAALPAPRQRGAAAIAAATSPADEAARRADRDHLETLLASLDADEARLIRLHHLDRRSYGEISRLTGMPLGSIGPALSRARDKMRRLEEPAHGGPPAGTATAPAASREADR